MKYVPQQKNTRVNMIIAAILVAGAIVYAVPPIAKANGISVINLPFDVLVFALIIAAVFIIVRYKMTAFEYSIRPRSSIESEIGAEEVFVSSADLTRFPKDRLDFVVNKTQGTRENMECVMSLGDLVSADEISLRGKNPDSLPTKDDIRKKYAADGFVFYDYTVTLGLECALELVFVDGNRYAGVIIEADDEMKEYFDEVCTNLK